MNDVKMYLCKTSKGNEYFTEEQIYKEVQRISTQILRKHYWGYTEYHDDLIQDVAVELFNAMHRYSPSRGEINGFIFGVASREISTQIRKIIRQQSHQIRLTDEMAAIIPSPDIMGNADAERDYISEFEKYLNATERKVLEMKLDGMNNTQIYNKLHRTKRKRIGKAMQGIWESIERKYLKFKGGETDGND